MCTFRGMGFPSKVQQKRHLGLATCLWRSTHTCSQCLSVPPDAVLAKHSVQGRGWSRPVEQRSARRFEQSGMANLAQEPRSAWGSAFSNAGWCVSQGSIAFLFLSSDRHIATPCLRGCRSACLLQQLVCYPCLALPALPCSALSCLPCPAQPCHALPVVSGCLSDCQSLCLFVRFARFQCCRSMFSQRFLSLSLSLHQPFCCLSISSSHLSQLPYVGCLVRDIHKICVLLNFKYVFEPIFLY